MKQTIILTKNVSLQRTILIIMVFLFSTFWGIEEASAYPTMHFYSLYYVYNCDGTVTFYVGAYNDVPTIESTSLLPGAIILTETTAPYDDFLIPFTGTTLSLPPCANLGFSCNCQPPIPFTRWQSCTMSCVNASFDVAFQDSHLGLDMMACNFVEDCITGFKHITLNCPAIPVLTASINNPICSGSCNTLTASPTLTGTEYWHWYKNSCGGTSVGTGNSIFVRPTATTTYYARREGFCEGGCCIAITIQVCPPIIVQSTITYQNNCQGCISLNASGGCQAGNYLFSIDNGLTFQSIPMFCGLNAGTYSIVVKDASGCTAARSMVISPPIPILSLTINNHDFPNCCPQLTVNNQTNCSFQWNGPCNFSSTSSSPCPVICDGIYCVTVTENGSGCTATACIERACHDCGNTTCKYWAVGGNSSTNGGYIDGTFNLDNILGINDVGLDGSVAPVGGQINLSPLRIFANSTEKMRVLSTGEVLINSTSRASLTTTSYPNTETYLQVKATCQNGILSQVDGSCMFSYPGPPANYAIRGEYYGGNSIWGTSGFASYFWSRPFNAWAGYFVGDVRVTHKLLVNATWYPSDSNLKNNVNNLTNALSTINQLRPRTFEFNLTQNPYMDLPEGNQYGFISQEVRSVIPDLVDSVKYAPESDTSGNVVYEGGTYLGLNYNSMIPIAIAGIKELDAKVNNLSANTIMASCPLTNYHLPKSTGGDSLCNSQIIDNGVTVGIGTGTDQLPSGYKMVVEGKFGARDIIVACPPSWPDYVFESNHFLQPLEEVDSYVTSNKHLPGIPSQKEIEKAGGINVGEMQTKQMEKIEELYQYIIEMNKNMQKLSLENKQLKDRVISLEKK